MALYSMDLRTRVLADSQLGCVWDPDRALELWADRAARNCHAARPGAGSPHPPAPPPAPGAELPSGPARDHHGTPSGSRREFDHVDPTKPPTCQ